MRLCVIVFILAALLLTSAYGMDTDTREKLIGVYNLTTNLYNLIAVLLDDLEEKKISSDSATGKINEWGIMYENKSKPRLAEAEKACELMDRLINAVRETTRTYQPNNQNTKDLMKQFDSIKSDLKQALNELRYSLQ
jgi:hypothetical protein